MRSWVKESLFLISGLIIFFLFAEAALAQSDRFVANNNAFHLEFDFSEMAVVPDIFYDEALNGDTIKLQGGEAGIAKSFALGENFYSALILRGGQRTHNEEIVELGLVRKSTLMSYNGVIQIGFNIRSWMIDGATMQPFVAGGYHQSTFTDKLTFTDETEEFNKITESGLLMEAGVNFVDQHTGVFSIFKVSQYLSGNKSYDSSIEEVPAGTKDYSINEVGTYNTGKSTYYVIGFGVKF